MRTLFCASSPVARGGNRLKSRLPTLVKAAVVSKVVWQAAACDARMTENLVYVNLIITDV